MTKEELDREAYSEQMYERRANGLPTMSFANWKRQKEAIRKLFEEKAK